jgi:hypothetical protein
MSIDFGGVPGNLVCPVTTYGQALASNKRAVYAACNACGGGLDECALVVAMAMIETTFMNATARDASKDWRTDGSVNVGLWNLNTDLVAALNYSGDPWTLNAQTPQVLAATACALLRGARTWGAARLMNFVRGGRTAFNDGWSFDAWGYRNAIKTIVDWFRRDPALLLDGRRVDCPLRPV